MQKTPETPPRRGSALQNPLSLLGWIFTVVAFAASAILMLADIIWFRNNVYNSVITYMIAPGLIFLGLGVVLVGYALELRRRKQHPELAHYPDVNLNRKSTRRWLIVGTALIAIFVSVSAVGGYQAYHFTDSIEFCGKACHNVMVPEYTAYQGSPHARVACVDCHIGTGAEWYVRAKLTGLRQVWKYTMDTYRLPIEVPVHSLRPARDICEQCHWPSKFAGNLEKVVWYFQEDEANTPQAFHLLLKVGGGSESTGRVGGIHWHISRKDKVEYWASNQELTEIPWIRVTRENGKTTVFKTDDAPKDGPPADEIHVMDCMDCHNRPTHIYYPPKTSLDASLVAGRLDRHIPNVYRTGLALISADYPDTPTAKKAIADGVEKAYRGKLPAASMEAVTAELQRIFATTRFPEQGVDWRTYPNFIGHMIYPGCDRCHDGSHTSDSGKTISDDCELCHTLVAQPTGEAAFGPVVYKKQEFQHPGGEGLAIMPCASCHAVPDPQPSTLMTRRAEKNGKKEEKQAARADETTADGA